MLSRKTPMRRTGFKRKPDSPFSSLANRGTSLRRTAIKRRVRKPTVDEGAHYLAACRGEPCYLRIPGVCHLNPRDRTVVPCHSNLLEHGGGMGLKAEHRFTFPGCDLCHYWLDRSRIPTKQERRDATLVALGRWIPVRKRKMAALEATR
ncbi:nuclease domain-containing protein [Paraburkholderia nodosa]|uniref:nuclease domain-containing protein n=1 Tax=Paraburkholderia nodosa TaxID=392320 RepID=UPI0004BA8078|nr:nuclease domain-containing protein [Paraburkholderia nodosa]